MELNIKELTVGYIWLIQDDDNCRWYKVALAQEDPVTCMTVEITVQWDPEQEHLKQFLKDCCGLDSFDDDVHTFSNDSGRIEGSQRLTF